MGREVHGAEAVDEGWRATAARGAEGKGRAEAGVAQQRADAEEHAAHVAAAHQHGAARLRRVADDVRLGAD